MTCTIVYTSNTGHTKQYAELLSNSASLPYMELKEAILSLPKDSPIIYMGWLAAGMIKGYSQAAKNFDIKAVCGVGMASGDSQIADMRKANKLSETLPLFYLPGGFEMDKLHGIYLFMMKTMKATVGRKLAGKAGRTPQEDDMLDLLNNGGSRVSKEHLAKILEWFNSAE
ncbi:MAG: hypothetical protein CW338_08845 [Clostridiales bacterium]|nr:hypothetical protein [Clostridiales bacterium]